jgi:hypothetical protein
MGLPRRDRESRKANINYEFCYFFMKQLELLVHNITWDLFMEIGTASLNPAAFVYLPISRDPIKATSPAP